MNAQATLTGQSATVTAQYIRHGERQRVAFASHDSHNPGFSLDELDALEHAIRIARITLRENSSTAQTVISDAFAEQQRRRQLVPT